MVELGLGNVSFSKLLGIAHALETTATELVAEAEDSPAEPDGHGLS